ncbi:MAG: MmcQ/YjbR family DNA-binding protein [Saprospiraceae bacterium]|nr:MmcQ/YjbR family DNA-binding protein [Saprospiraceae bacterium]
MVNFSQLKEIALSFPEATEEPHFEKTSFRVRKKIFVTYEEKDQKACLKLSLEDQSVFSSMSKGSVYLVPNKWGGQGWTFFELQNISLEFIHDALKCAYIEVAPKGLADLV